MITNDTFLKNAFLTILGYSSVKIIHDQKEQFIVSKLNP